MNPDLAENQEFEAIGDACFSYLVGDVEELQRFMAISGYDSDSIRSAVGSESLLRGMMEYFAANEPALLALCANSGLSASRFMRAWHKLNPHG